MPDIDDDTYMPALPDEAEISAELEAMRNEMVTMTHEDYIRGMRFAEELGKVKSATAISKFLDLTVLRWFAYQKESKEYKTSPVVFPGGRILRVETFEQLCEVADSSRSTVDENLQNLATFGEDCLEAMRRGGLSFRGMRPIRKGLKGLPEEEKQSIIEGLQKASPEEIRPYIEAICNRNSELMKDKKKAEKALAAKEEENQGLREDIKAKAEVAKTRNERIEELKDQLERATSSIPADVEWRKQEKDLNARKLLDSKAMDLIQACMAFAAQANEILRDAEVSDDTASYVHTCASNVVDVMGARFRDAGLDVDPTREFRIDYGDLDEDQTDPDTMN